jgi:hypothetical protein
MFYEQNQHPKNSTFLLNMIQDIYIYIYIYILIDFLTVIFLVFWFYTNISWYVSLLGGVELGGATMMSMEESTKRRPFFSSPDELLDEEYYDEQLPEKKRRLTPEQVCATGYKNMLVILYVSTFLPPQKKSLYIPL